MNERELMAAVLLELVDNWRAEGHVWKSREDRSAYHGDKMKADMECYGPGYVLGLIKSCGFLAWSGKGDAE